MTAAAGKIDINTRWNSSDGFTELRELGFEESGKSRPPDHWYSGQAKSIPCG